MKKNRERGYINISGFDIVVGLFFVALLGGLVLYVVLPWLWKIAIKPALLWMLT